MRLKKLWVGIGLVVLIALVLATAWGSQGGQKQPRL